MLLVLYKSAQASYITGVVIDVVHLWNLVLTGLSLCKDMITEGQRQKNERKQKRNQKGKVENKACLRSLRYVAPLRTA